LKGEPYAGSDCLVHDTERFADRAAFALCGAGYEVAVFADPIKALNALDTATTVEILITRVNYPPGKPNGVALALMPDTAARMSASYSLRRHTEG
jgi:hypothetical protein